MRKGKSEIEDNEKKREKERRDGKTLEKRGMNGENT